MNVKRDWRVTGLGLLAVLTAACGDDGTGGVSATSSASAATETTNPPGTSTQSSMSATDSGPTTSTTAGSDSEGQTTTTAGPTTDPGTTTQALTSTSGTSTGPGTSTTDDTTGTTGTTTGDSTSTTDGTTSTSTSTTGNDTEGAMCPLAMMHTPCDADSDDALHAMGLNCTSLGGNYQNNINAVAVSNIVFQAPPPILGERTWQVAEAYGTFIDPNTNQPFWGPREGEKLLMISSGLLPPPDGNGTVIVADGDVYNDSGVGGQWDSDVMPPPMSPQHGSPDPMGFTNCDGVNDCSNTILDQWNLGGGDAEDKMWFGFELTAPAIVNGDQADANGYTFDFAYFSAEFPEYVDSVYNDIFVVWQASEDYTGNVTFVNGQPMTVTALWPIDFQGECDFLDPNCQGADPHLEGTGYIDDGGATSWYKATGGINPGETFTLTFGVFDMGDSSFDTTALLDNWMWDCEGCVPSEIDDCGIAPQ